MLVTNVSIENCLVIEYFGAVLARHLLSGGVHMVVVKSQAILVFELLAALCTVDWSLLTSGQDRCGYMPLGYSSAFIKGRSIGMEWGGDRVLDQRRRLVEFEESFSARKLLFLLNV